MVKLNIEMSMAGLITKLARNSVAARDELAPHSSSHNPSHHLSGKQDTKSDLRLTALEHQIPNQNSASATAGPWPSNRDDMHTMGGIGVKRDVHILVEEGLEYSSRESSERELGHKRSYGSGGTGPMRRASSDKDDDDVPLHKNSMGFYEPRTDIK
jgi:hypothetical protein